MVTIKKLTSFSFSLIIIIFFSIGSVFSKENDNKNRAIIIVPGILSCGLFNSGERTSIYHHNEVIWITASKRHPIESLKSAYKFIKYKNSLYCDDNGNPIDKNIGPPSDDLFLKESDKNVAKYGVLSIYNQAINMLDYQFGYQTPYKCKTILYNYDWRLDCSKNAKLLTNEIMKYDEVILIGYSLGGLVSCKCACNLLEMGEIHRIKTFISVATPYNGSPLALFMLENGTNTGSRLLDKVIKLLSISEIIKNVAKNCPSVYQLLPNHNFFEKNPNGYIFNDSKKWLGYNDTVKLIKDKSWYKKTNGDNKTFLETADSFHKSLYIDNKHIVNYLNSYFIVGAGIKTPTKLKLTPSLKQKVVICGFANGDGTVPLEDSAMPPVLNINEDRVFKVKSKHSSMFKTSRVIKQLISLISNSLNSVA